MKKHFFTVRHSVIFSAILTFSLLLAGCGRGTAGSEESSAEDSGQLQQTISADSEEQETTDKTETTQGQLQYIEDIFSLGLPVVTEEQALADGKTLLTLKPNLSNTWLKEAVNGFNRQSADYFIRLEEPKTDGDEERITAEIIAGRGPDILSGNVLNITESLLKKGVLVDLAPGLDAMGITDEDYFPGFRTLRMGDSVYGIHAYLSPTGRSIREAVLGSREQPDIETLVEKLYTYPDQGAVFWGGARSEAILEYLLSCSEDLWGMIDWENGTCDFSGELFTKILEIAKRYADPERTALDAEDRKVLFYYEPMSNPLKELESEGKVVINYPFDDGNYPAYFRLNDALMLNANSKHQEGGWEFLKYILGSEGQSYASSGVSIVASKDVSRGVYEYNLKLLEEGTMQTTSDYSPEEIEALFAFVEQGHQVPLRTKEILAIIYEEAQTFCDGDKPLEDVRNTIETRVQLYISETM